MKNNTKVRLHLSKQLFESLTKEIIKEAKANDGYTVAVKQPKAPKQVKEVNAMADTDKMEKMEEKMSSKEKMAKGLYNEEEMLNEIDPSSIDWSVIAAGLGAIGLAPILIDKIHNLWKRKFPKSFEKAQSLSGTIDKQASGN